MAGQDHHYVRIEAVGTIGVMAALALSLVVAGCKPADTPSGAPAGIDTSGYLAPPAVTKAVRGQGGSLNLVGVGPGDAEIRLQAPAGEGFSATSNDDGAWSVTLPPSDVPRMFSFEGETSGRVLHGEGALLTLPAPGPPVVLARAGYGSLVIGETAGPLRISVIDYDNGGGGAVSGLTAPHAPVRLVIDDQTVGAGEADAMGRFTVLDLSARKPLTAGSHTLRVETQIGGHTGAVQGQWTVTPAAPLNEAIFRASRQAGAWRVDWRIPGGGAQTTVVFDQPQIGVGL